MGARSDAATAKMLAAMVEAGLVRVVGTSPDGSAVFQNTQMMPSADDPDAIEKVADALSAQLGQDAWDQIAGDLEEE